MQFSCEIYKHACLDADAATVRSALLWIATISWIIYTRLARWALQTGKSATCSSDTDSRAIRSALLWIATITGIIYTLLVCARAWFAREAAARGESRRTSLQLVAGAGLGPGDADADAVSATFLRVTVVAWVVDAD